MNDDSTPYEYYTEGIYDNAAYNSSNETAWYQTDYIDGADRRYERIIVPLIFCIVIVFGCIGNILVIVVVIRNREQYASTTNIFIVNLAVADLAFLVFCVPFHAIIYTHLEGWPFGNAVCKLVHGVQFASMAASIYTLVAMSLDRFLAVGYPLRTKHLRQPPAALAVVVGVWIASLLLAAPWLAVYTVHQYDAPGFASIPVCADDWAALGWHRPTGFLVLFFVDYAVPLALIGVLSALTVSRLWATEMAGDGEPAQNRSVLAKQRVTRLIVAVVVVFALCWLPSHVVWLWTNYFRSTWRHTYVFYYGRITAHVLSYANSCMNPIIYAFVSSRFRREFRRALDCHYAALTGAAIPGSSAADRHVSARRDVGGPLVASSRLHSVVVMTTAARGIEERPTTMVLSSSRNRRPLDQLDHEDVATI